MNWPSQTDPDLYGWSYAFPIKEQDDLDWKRTYVEHWTRWLAQWNPPPEWMQ